MRRIAAVAHRRVHDRVSLRASVRTMVQDVRPGGLLTLLYVEHDCIKSVDFFEPFSETIEYETKKKWSCDDE